MSASGIEIGSEFRNDSSVAAFAQPLGGNGGDAGDWNFVPAAYFVLPVGDTLAFGIGVNAPFGLKLVYDDGWIGRFQALHNEIKTLNLNPSVAWRIGERISLGAGIDYQRLDAELTNDVNYSAVVAQGVQQLVPAGQLPPATGAAVIAANAGRIGPRPRARRRRRLGIQCRRAVRSVGRHATRTFVSIVDRLHRGRHDFASLRPPGADPISNGIIAAGFSTRRAVVLRSGQVSIWNCRTPPRCRCSIASAKEFALLADVAWTGWSSVQELRIVRDSGATASVTPERWRDTWRYALGRDIRDERPRHAACGRGAR